MAKIKVTCFFWDTVYNVALYACVFPIFHQTVYSPPILSGSLTAPSPRRTPRLGDGFSGKESPSGK